MANIKLPKFVDSYLNNMIIDGKKETTVKRYRSDLRVLLKWRFSLKDEDLTLDELTSLQKQDYIAFISWLRSNKYSDGSINRICTVVAKLLQYLNISHNFTLRDLVDAPKSFPLKKDDFISNKELKDLLDSFTSNINVPDSLLLAHKELANRNVSITLLIRYYGLTPAQVSAINMEDINFTHDELTIHRKDGTDYTYKLQTEHKKVIKKYLDDVEENIRPRYYSTDPLFVSYNNTHMRFQYDYSLPKRLAERSIINMLKVEVSRAELRSLSSTHLRNRCILDYLKDGHTDKETMDYFGITYLYHLKRFKKYLSTNLPS
jgi:site-specific recombinase XerD